MDLTRDVIYRGFTLNDEDIRTNIVAGRGTGGGISGCVLDSADISDVDVVQFLEKRSQQDGMDAGVPFLGTRRIRLAGTLYNVTRATLYDDLMDLRAAMSPVLAQREEPLDMGYRPLYFSIPTNRIADYPAGAIDLQVRAMPRSFSAQFSRDQQGGDDDDSLAIPWQAVLICKDPSILSDVPVEVALSTQTHMTGATIAAATNLVSKVGHGLVANDRVRFTVLTGGVGLSLATDYYVISSGLTADVFKVSTTFGGSEVDITDDYESASFVEAVTTSGTLSNRGSYLTPVDMLINIGSYSCRVSATIGDSIFTITVPASTGARIIRFKGSDKVLTVEEGAVETPQMSYLAFTGTATWPLIEPGSSAYSITVYGGVTAADSEFWYYERYA